MISMRFGRAAAQKGDLVLLLLLLLLLTNGGGDINEVWEGGSSKERPRIVMVAIPLQLKQDLDLNG